MLSRLLLEVHETIQDSAGKMEKVQHFSFPTSDMQVAVITLNTICDRTREQEPLLYLVGEGGDKCLMRSRVDFERDKLAAQRARQMGMGIPI